MRKLLFLIPLIFLGISAKSQQLRPANSAKIYHELNQLQHLVNVLYFAAHPDDENTRLLAWLVNEQHVRTAYLSLTRGDGGQNLLGSEQGEALGLMRTHELMEARKIDGAEQFFTRAIDFGFSKNSDETFKHWNEDLLTHDAVWVIRKFRPDVIICRFPPTAQAGHGQHAVSAIIAANAFTASADPKKYPEELKTYPAWQAKRLLWNTFNFGSVNTTSADQLKIEVGQYSPLLGMGYGELAGASRSVHKSQGAGTPSVPGIETEYFKLVKGDPASKSLFDGIDISWNRIGRNDIGNQIKSVIETYDFNHPDASLPALLKIRKAIKGVKDEYWRNEKLQEVDQIILDCSGLMAEIYSRKPEAVKEATLPFTLNVIARSATPVTLKAIKWMNNNSVVNENIGKDFLKSYQHSITIPASASPTAPYWLVKPSEDDYYEIANEDLLGLPETPSRLNASLLINIGGEDFNVDVPLSYKKLDPVKGDVVEQLRIVPDAVVEFTQNLILARSNGAINSNVHIHPFKDFDNATLTINVSGKPVSEIKNLRLKAGADTVISFAGQIPQNQLNNDSLFLEAALIADGETYNETQHVIRYPHIPTLQYFTPAQAKVLANNWKCNAKKIGYIEGAGDYIDDFLRLAGLDVTILKDADFTNADKLSQYDAIITGIRAANTERKMAYWLPVLFNYVKNGGTLVMQYNKPQQLATNQLGPYPFTFTTARVTEEDAKVDFLQPSHQLLNYPNKITQSDFAGWVQERGLYFPVKWDNHYQPLFKMNDTGEQPLTGSALYLQYGKGNYIYTGLSFFRQIPAGNTGAIRLLMNMLSAGK